jgi:hypothetical protein
VWISRVVQLGDRSEKRSIRETQAKFAIIKFQQPTTDAPSSMASRASSTLLMQHTFTRGGKRITESSLDQ